MAATLDRERTGELHLESTSEATRRAVLVRTSSPAPDLYTRRTNKTVTYPRTRITGWQVGSSGPRCGHTTVDSSGAQARHPHLLHAGDPENSRQSRNASALRRPTARPSVIVVRATKPEMVRTSCREAYVSDGMLFGRSRRRVERNWGMVIVLEETSRAIILWSAMMRREIHCP